MYFLSFFINFPSSIFLHFLPQFGLPGGWGRPWLRHWTQFDQNWVLFFLKWYTDGWEIWQKNCYGESQIFEVRQAHPCTILVKVTSWALDTQVFPECIATSYSSFHNQIMFLFHCTEKYDFYGKKKLLLHEWLVKIEAFVFWDQLVLCPLKGHWTIFWNFIFGWISFIM